MSLNFKFTNKIAMTLMLMAFITGFFTNGAMAQTLPVCDTTIAKGSYCFDENTGQISQVKQNRGTWIGSGTKFKTRDAAGKYWKEHPPAVTIGQDLPVCNPQIEVGRFCFDSRTSQISQVIKSRGDWIAQGSKFKTREAASKYWEENPPPFAVEGKGSKGGNYGYSVQNSSEDCVDCKQEDKSLKE